MIVVFLVVLVVFGPQKLPELARSFGKLMAEFRKASNDFKSAFEEEMRDLERQARLAEMKKQVAEATVAANTAMAKAAQTQGTANPAVPANGSSSSIEAAEQRPPDGPVITPVAESVPRLDASNGDSSASNSATTVPTEHPSSESAAEPAPSHDQRQPA
jgi:sec-independent protein translocase protein TatB